MNEKFDELKRRLGEVVDLSRVSSYLGLGPAGADARRSAPRFGRRSRRRSSGSSTSGSPSPEIGHLLDDLRPYEDSLDPDSDEASLIRVTRRDWEKARKVPTELRGEMAHAAAEALPVWVEARENSDFKAFLPHLRVATSS